MQKVSRRRLSQVVVGLLQQRPQDRQHILQMLAAYLVERKQQKQLDLLLLDIAHQLQLSVGHLYAEVTLAHPLDAATRDQLEAYLRKATNASKVELSETVDGGLLAGAIVRTSDQELDTSARTKLKQLSSLNVTIPGGL